MSVAERDFSIKSIFHKTIKPQGKPIMNKPNTSATIAPVSNAPVQVLATSLADGLTIAPAIEPTETVTDQTPVVEQPVTLAELVGQEKADAMLTAYTQVADPASLKTFRLAFFTELKDVRVIDLLKEAVGEKAVHVPVSISVSDITVEPVSAAFLRSTSVDLNDMTVAALKAKREQAKKDVLSAILILGASKHYARIRDLVTESGKQGIRFELSDFVETDTVKFFSFDKGADKVAHIVKVTNSFKCVALNANGAIYVKQLSVADIACDGLSESVKKAFSLTEFTGFIGRTFAELLSNKDSKGRIVDYTSLRSAFTGLTNKAVATSYAAFPELKDGLAALIANGAKADELQGFIVNQKAKFGMALKGAANEVKASQKA